MKGFPEGGGGVCEAGVTRNPPTVTGSEMKSVYTDYTHQHHSPHAPQPTAIITLQNRQSAHQKWTSKEFKVNNAKK